MSHHVQPGYDFSREFRESLARAREEAARLGNDRVETGHVLLGLVATGRSRGARVLEAAGLDPVRLRREVVEATEPGSRAPGEGPPDLPYTTQTKRCIEESMKVAHETEASHVDTEHLLVGLLRHPRVPACRVLQGLGLDERTVREHAERLGSAGTLAAEAMGPPDELIPLRSAAPLSLHERIDSRRVRLSLVPARVARLALLAVTLLLSLLVLLAASTARASAQSAQAPARGTELANLTWLEAERILGPSTVVVIPLGAGAKEHGPHLRLDNDFQIAEYLKRRVLAASDVVVAPTITYHFYPAFLEYPGSTHLREETARDVVVDIVRSLARHGPRRFYVLNSGVSTVRPLTASAEVLKREGILLHFTDILKVAGPAEEKVRQQQRGTHADEIETSMMLYMTPDRVDMSKAVRDDSPRGTGGLTRDPNGPGTYSKSGVWGDATLATREKGRVIVEAMVEGILREIEVLRAAAIP